MRSYWNRVREAYKEYDAIRNRSYSMPPVGEPATIDGLMKELDVADRLQGMINRCLKQLLMVRGVKSVLSAAAPSESAPQIGGPRKAG
jgi:hypothetical protein